MELEKQKISFQYQEHIYWFPDFNMDFPLIFPRFPSRSTNYVHSHVVYNEKGGCGGMVEGVV